MTEPPAARRRRRGSVAMVFSGLLACAVAAASTGSLCSETQVLQATRITGAKKTSSSASTAARTLIACRVACCAADECVAWTFDSTAMGGGSCALFAERGVLAEAAANISSSYRPFSVSPSSQWEWSWDTVPLYSHSSNASGLYSRAALANLTSGVYGRGVHALDWEVNYTATRSHHLRQCTTEQARAIVAAKPAMRVFVYQQGLLASNYSDAESAALQDRSKDSWWIHDPSGVAHAWDFGNGDPRYCDYGQRCARVLNASVPELRKWFVDEVALPTIADPAVAGLFYDNSMQLGQPNQAWVGGNPAVGLELQRASAELQRQIGEAVLAHFPGKRTLLSVQTIVFTDNQPPPPPTPAVHGFDFLFDGCCRGGPASSFQQLGNLSASACAAACTNDALCNAIELDGCLGRSECGSGCFTFTGNGSGPIINGACGAPVGDQLCYQRHRSGKTPPPSPPASQPNLLPEQELVRIWRDVPWGRFYECWPHTGCGASGAADCVAAVRNVQAEALAGIPVAASFAYGVRPASDDEFELALAMFLMAAEKHSRFGYVRH